VPDRIQAIAIAVCIVFLLVVLELVRRRKLIEEYSFLWIVVAALMLAVAIWRELLHAAARELGVHDPPNVLLIALTAVVVVALLWVSVVLSRQRRQIERLMEEASILGAELREIRDDRERKGS
jgi:NO-binding membrane sensor protein with MHYT domain